MSIEDEARAEAKRQYEEGLLYTDDAQSGYVKGYLAASRREPSEPPTVTEWSVQIANERARQIGKGYDLQHDSEHGIAHLLNWAIDYARRGKAVESSALIAAALNLVPSPPEPSDTDEREWEYGSGYRANGKWFGMPETGYIIREAAENEVEAYSDRQIRLVRRRKAGPWEVVPDGE